MNTNERVCPKCGKPLKKGNIEIVRKKGKRPVRQCRRCPGNAGSPKVLKVDAPSRSGMTLTTVADFVTTSQAKKGQFVTLQATLDGRPPPRTRFFIRPAMAEKIRRAMGKPVSAFGITVEIIPVPADQVEAFPEQFQELIEVEMNIKGVEL